MTWDFRISYECGVCGKEVNNGEPIEDEYDGTWLCADCSKTYMSEAAKYRSIIEHYGEPAQVLKAIEEMTELICDLLLGFDTYDEVTIDDIDYMWSKIDTVRRFAQYHVNIESCEFDKAVSKSVKLECADVENMLDQLRLMFGSWENKRVEKLDRTMERIRK